jgi:hypothetical protein
MTPEPKIIHLTALLLNAMQTKTRIEALQQSDFMRTNFKGKLNNYLAQTNDFILFCNKIANFDTEELEELGCQLGEAQDEGLRELFNQEISNV